MNGRWQSGRKNDIAQKLFSEALDSLKGIDNLELALRVYGHQTNVAIKYDCEDTKLEVPFAEDNVEKIKKRLKTIKYQGTTPIANTLEKAADDFPSCADCRNIIVLITDGIEECNGDPCAISKQLQDKGVVLKPFVIGVGLDMEFKKTFACIGTYFDASIESNFKLALKVVISQALNSTTSQVNFLDDFNNPTETDISFTMYDRYTGSRAYDFVHALNSRGLPDTLNIEPLNTYRLVAHTLPSKTIDSVGLTPGIHNIIALSTPQGNLVVKSISGKSEVPIIVRKSGELKTLNIQNSGERVKYITGTYDLEILTLPRIYVNDVKISQSTTTTVDYPTPGLATILRASKSHGDILKLNENGAELVYKLNPNALKESVNLQPGSYLVVNKPISARGSDFTVTKEFTINSGQSTQVKIY